MRMARLLRLGMSWDLITESERACLSPGAFLESSPTFLKRKYGRNLWPIYLLRIPLCTMGRRRDCSRKPSDVHGHPNVPARPIRIYLYIEYLNVERKNGG